MKYLLLIFLFIISCSKTNNFFLISKEKKNELKAILKSDSLQFLKDDNDYNLIVKESKLTTELGQEMGASISSLILYDEVVSDNPSLNFNTTFYVKYSDKNLLYSYELQDLSDVIKAQTFIDDIIISLKEGKQISSKNFDNEKVLMKLKKINIDWFDIEGVSFAGFKIEKNINQNNIILLKVFINPYQSELWFYLDKKNKKILQIDVNA